MLSAIDSAGDNAPDQRPAGEGANETGHGIDGNQCPLDVDTGQFRRLRIIADCVDMPHPSRVPQDIGQYHHEDHHQDDAVGEDRSAKLELRSQRVHHAVVKC